MPCNALSKTPSQAFSALFPPAILLERCSVLNPTSQEYFRRTREATGKRLEDISSLEQQREAHWNKIEEEFEKVDGWFAKSDHGDFILGDVISYADITIAAWILWMKTIFGADSKEMTDIEGWHEGRWATFIANFQDFEGGVA
jgi:glutathione S-transferase